jgi:hypothetical protein
MNLFSLFAMLLLVTQNHIPLKGSQQQNQPQTNCADAQSPAPTDPATEVGKENAANAERYAYYKAHKKEYLKAAITPASASNWVLAVLGVFGGFLALFTLLAIKRQTDLLVDKERARVRVEMVKVEWGRGAVEVLYNVISYGPTPAIITNCWASGTVNNTDSVTIPRFEMPMRIPPVFCESTVETSAYVLDKTSFTEQDIVDFRTQKLFMHVSGCINYEDIFGKKRKTPFSYVCKTTDYVRPDGTIHQYWFKQGKRKDNRAT